MSESIYFFDLVRWDGENDDEEDALSAKGHAFLQAKFHELGIPAERIGWDDYDGSVEIFAPDPFRLSPDIQKKLWDMGFIKAYVNHGGPSAWETHYSFGTSAGFKAAQWLVLKPALALCYCFATTKPWGCLCLFAAVVGAGHALRVRS